MARGAEPSSLRDDGDNNNSHAQEYSSKASKRRRCVQSACVPCRKRKSKASRCSFNPWRQNTNAKMCDGSTPVCATCTAVYKTECHYDAESESRRSKSGSSSTPTTGIKRDASSVIDASSPEHASNAVFIIDSLRQLPEEHVQELIQHLRKDPKLDIATLAESWRSTVTLPPSAPVQVHSLESDLSVLLGNPAITLTGESRHFGHSASLGLVPEQENFAGGRMRNNTAMPERQGSTWTAVTNDLAFVDKLLTLYFTWSHPFYVLFSRECFYKDFRAGREKYCSPLLVNAVCAYACHLTDDAAGRTDPTNFRTAGDHYFAEAKRLLFEDETPSLTTAQALCVMSLREPSSGRDSSGFSYIGRCIRMCVELGLHLNNSASPVLGLTPSEIEVRKVTFWGCFTVDTVWSICTGRIAQLPRAAITLDKPILEESSSLLEAFPGASSVPPGIVTTRMFLQEFTSLSELVNDNNYMFFAPRERLTSTRLLDCYSKYQAWYRRLPVALGVEGKEQPEPHILVLHMLYYTIIVHLFRPMLKVELIHSDVHPRDICIDAANNVSRLVRIYRSFYDFRVAHLLIPHILLSVCIVHLLYSKDNNTSRQNLVEGLKGLEDLHECHYLGARSFRIIHTLARKWKLAWPDELRNSKLVPQEKPQGAISPPTDPLLVAPNTVTTTMGLTVTYPPISQANRRESLSMFAPRMQMATHPVTSRSSSVVSSQHHPSPVVGHAPTHATYNASITLASYQYSQSLSSVPSTVPTTGVSPKSETTEALFWTPMPGIPGPILPRNNFLQASPMGLESVLQSADMGDRLGRDGFKINEDWRSSHVNGFNTGTAGSVYGATRNDPAAGNYAHDRGSMSYAQPGDSVAYQQPGMNEHHGQGQYNPGWWPNANDNPGPIS
ncbi:C6 transcription factor-like protein [Cucurbitaria berberidis CBS 394.84]|uniref:C6 transcription factor-like protein n=1 Tax=Cucurbitaria berberidis CBS 394.84 TaxID=1168544 RepID=A0A9P4GNQ8_9PLEO|nr:C6 transcription factor-like protein [Cucurbitaria berberidis CBS 394.84]KAF1849858.1 C6 transcription factor-like protein [Cucurbitaria berberidis CBS 394.84]